MFIREVKNRSGNVSKFWHQKDWSCEYSPKTLITESDLVFIVAGNDVNGRDSGNLGLLEGKYFEEGKTYVFTVDVTQGRDKAILTIEKM